MTNENFIVYHVLRDMSISGEKKFVSAGTDRVDQAVIFFTVLFSSMVGAQIFGVSLNKIALIPLELLCFKRGLNCHVLINQKQKMLFSWYLFTILSCFLGLFRSDLGKYNSYYSRLILYAVQIFIIYIPLMLYIHAISNVLEKFKKAIILVAEINAIWGIVQFVAWYGFAFDFNSFIFDDILKGILGSGWTVWNYEAGSLALRVSGLNTDTAFYSIILILGFCMIDSLIWKSVFFMALLFSLSRAGIATVVLVEAYILFNSVAKKKTTGRKLRERLFFFAVLLAIFLMLYIFFPSIQYQINYAVFRFASIFDSSTVSSSRHTSYISGAVKVWLFDFDLIEKMFGVGPRCGGLGLVTGNSVKGYIEFGTYMESNAWAVECGYAEILMGHGILGFLLYGILLKVFREESEIIRYSILGILVMDIMYNLTETTLIQLFIIILVSTNCHLKPEE